MPRSSAKGSGVQQCCEGWMSLRVAVASPPAHQDLICRFSVLLLFCHLKKSKPLIWCPSLLPCVFLKLGFGVFWWTGHSPGIILVENWIGFKLKHLMYVIWTAKPNITLLTRRWLIFRPFQKWKHLWGSAFLSLSSLPATLLKGSIFQRVHDFY